MKLNGFVYDVEADDLYFGATTLWVINFTDLDTREKLSVHPFQDADAVSKIEAWVGKYNNPLVIGHNILGYDQFVLMKLLKLPFTVGPDSFCGKKCVFIDTFYMSMYLLPDRVGHGIGPWGERLGLSKIDWRERAIQLGLIKATDPKGAEFKQWHPEMGVYCERDVEVNIRVFYALLQEYEEAHGPWKGELHQSYKCGQKSFFLMSCQGYAGWKFDIEKAEALKPRIQQMMEDIRSTVESQLPPRPLKKGEEKEYTMPAKPWKMDGTFSSHMLNFIEKHSAKVIDTRHIEVYDEIVEIESKKILDVKVKMEIANQEQIKEWFLQEGWSPTLWNFKKDSKGKPERDQYGKLIPTSPKIQEQGKICANLLLMEGALAKDVVKWLSLRNRLGVLEGWLSNERLAMDGRLSTDRSGIAATHRQKHKTVVNVPKASDKVLLGKEFRELFTADGWIAAADAAALEGRVQGHYTFKFDNGATAKELLEGDPHSKNASVFYEDDPVCSSFNVFAPDFNKEDVKFKPFRDRSKNGYYALLYGCSAPKLASTLGLPEWKGEQLLEKFWDVNPGTKALKDNTESFWNTTGGKKWLTGIDGRRLFTRKKSALLNTLFQSCGGIAMDYACCFMDMWLGDIHWDKYGRPFYIYKGKWVKRIGFYHDELEFECETEEIANEVAEMVVRAIVKAGEFLKLSIPLAGEGKVGKNWCEVH